MAKQFQIDTAGTLLTSLVAYYKTADATDFFGSNNLTNSGGVTFPATGKIANEANFGTALDRYLGDLSNNLGWGGGAVSISMWVNITTAPSSGGAYQTLFFVGTTSTQNNVEVRYQNPSGTLQLRAIREGGTRNDIIVNNTLTTATYFHVMFVYNGTTTELFVNNVSQGTGSNSGSGSDANNKNSFSLGEETYAQTPQSVKIKGRLCEIAVHLKAYSSQERSDLYNGGAGQTMIDVVVTNRGHLALMGVA